MVRQAKTSDGRCGCLKTAGNDARPADGDAQTFGEICRENTSLEGAERSGLAQPARLAKAAGNGQVDAHDRRKNVGRTTEEPV